MELCRCCPPLAEFDVGKQQAKLLVRLPNGLALERSVQDDNVLLMGLSGMWQELALLQHRARRVGARKRADRRAGEGF